MTLNYSYTFHFTLPEMSNLFCLDRLCGPCDHCYNNCAKHDHYIGQKHLFCCTFASITCCLPCTLYRCSYCIIRECCCCAQTLWHPRRGTLITTWGSERMTQAHATIDVTNYGECPCVWKKCDLKKPKRENMS